MEHCLSIMSLIYSSSEIFISFCSIISPSSALFPACIADTPIVFSPQIIAVAVGAKPLYLGNNESWNTISP